MLHRITIRTRRALQLADLSAVEALGVRVDRYGELDYGRTQAIGDAAYFLGFDGLHRPERPMGLQEPSRVHRPARAAGYGHRRIGSGRLAGLAQGSRNAEAEALT